MNKSSKPIVDRVDVRDIPLELLFERADNPNAMTEEQLLKLQRNIERYRYYELLTVRPHPEVPNAFEIISGAQRRKVMARLGWRRARCVVVECDDATALLLLMSLNRLRGEDLPEVRQTVLQELGELLPKSEIACLLPLSPGELDRALARSSLDPSTLLTELSAATESAHTKATRVISVAVPAEDVEAIETTIDRVAAAIPDRNRRGRALATICRGYMEAHRA